MHQQPARCPVCLEIEPRHDGFAKQEGQTIIAELALLGRRVDLDPVAEIEQAFRAGALPHDGIERREEGLGVDARGTRA